VSVTSAATNIARDNGIAPAVGLSQATVDGLVALGYSVGAPADIGSVQAVLIDPRTGKQYGAADARREGTVIGLPR
jgi:gamma-glutamyltranspeptidase/glutathione hydrolase